MAVNISHLENEIIDQYLADDNSRPWIIGFSGGKDSTMLLQLVWNALKKVEVNVRQSRRIYVVCNNTLVENPKILEYTEKVLNQIQKAAAEQSLPIEVHRTTPKIEDTFWVNLIGKGYPAPNNIFRWCTERMKISPTTHFITEKINKEGEVIILLGTRSAESANRARSIKKHEIDGKRLRKHILPNAYVFAAIKDVQTNDLWQYLSQVPSPWGSSNKELITLYRNANSGDCPLVIDDTTPSCGNSRFGCWTCTVVNRDKSMEGLVENGEEWMEPLMLLRDVLAKSRDDESCREKRGRDGSDRLGPYSDWFRAEFLEKLLTAQREIQETQPDVFLITYQELVAIQVTWYRDSHFNFNVSDIYHKVFGNRISIDASNESTVKEMELLKDVCKSNPGDFELINNLLAVQKTKTILMNNRGLQTVIENQLDKFIAKA